jgi:CRP/FNR family transcriptional regulator
MPKPTDSQLATSPLFGRLSPPDRALVAGVSEVRSYDPGAAVFTEGEPASVVFAILSGSVRVQSKAGGSDLPEVLEAGDPLGDVAAFEGGPYPASGTAVERTECLVIPRAELFRLLEQHPTLARGFVHGLTHRIVQLTKELRNR